MNYDPRDYEHIVLLNCQLEEHKAALLECQIELQLMTSNDEACPEQAGRFSEDAYIELQKKVQSIHTSLQQLRQSL